MRDIGHAMEGDFDKIDPETYRDLAEAVKDSMEGRTRVEIPVKDRVSV